MNRIERAKAKALTKCRILPGSWDERFVTSLAWLAEHDREAVLTPLQKYHLDAMVWKYRRQLVGRADLGFEMPTEPPREEAYQPPRKEPPQGVLAL